VGEKALCDTVRRLKKFGRVLISAERPLPESLKAYANPVPVEDVHHLLAYATLYMGEGGSMAAEAAVLGTPAIFTSVLECGYLVALEKQYDMVYNTTTIEEGTAIAEKLLANPDLKQQWQKKQQNLLDQSDDLCEFMVNTLIDLGSKKQK
jgi:predicted glycosyltransferase